VGSSRLTKEVIFRVDVCVPTGSFWLNRLHVNLGHLNYLDRILLLMRDNGIRATFMFVPHRTIPGEELVGEIRDLGSEIALHADEVDPIKLASQREQMTAVVGEKVVGISYHGRDLSDLIIHKLTRKTRYISYHNPFVSLQAGFEYDVSGFSLDRPRFLSYAGRRILLFQPCVDITSQSQSRQVDERMFGDHISVLLIHPFLLGRYGLRKSRMDEVDGMFNYVRKKEFVIRTCKDVLREICQGKDTDISGETGQGF